jgi:hypothetical protein
MRGGPHRGLAVAPRVKDDGAEHLRIDVVFVGAGRADPGCERLRVRRY